MVQAAGRHTMGSSAAELVSVPGSMPFNGFAVDLSATAELAVGLVCRETGASAAYGYADGGDCLAGLRTAVSRPVPSYFGGAIGPACIRLRLSRKSTDRISSASLPAPYEEDDVNYPFAPSSMNRVLSQQSQQFSAAHCSSGPLPHWSRSGELHSIAHPSMPDINMANPITDSAATIFVGMPPISSPPSSPECPGPVPFPVALPKKSSDSVDCIDLA